MKMELSSKLVKYGTEMNIYINDFISKHKVFSGVFKILTIIEPILLVLQMKVWLKMSDVS